jgi:ribonuclease E
MDGAPASKEAASVPALSAGLQAATAGTDSATAEASASGSGQHALEAETGKPLDEHHAAAARGAEELADALGGQSEQPGAAQAALPPEQRQALGAVLVDGGEEEDWMAQAAPEPAPPRRLKRLRRPGAPSVAPADQPPALADGSESPRSRSASPLASAPGSAAAGAAAAPAHLPARRGAVPAPSADSGSGAGSAGGDGALPADYWDEEDELEELVLKRKARASTGSGGSSPDAACGRAGPSGSHGGESSASDAGARPAWSSQQHVLRTAPS